MRSVLNEGPVVSAGRNTRVLLWPLLVGLLCTQPCLAGKYAYGEQIVRFGHSWSDAAPERVEAVRQSAQSLAEDDASYQQQLAAVEQGDGPYSDALAEPLTGLGRYHRQNGDLEQAMRLYRRALHIVRINDGLYSERQIPILQSILEAYRLSGDLQSLDDRYDYYFRLYGSGQAPYTELRLRATLAYLRWQREALRLEIDGDDGARLFELHQLNRRIIEAVGADPTVPLPLYRDLVLSQLRNLYLLEDRYAPTVENMGVAPPLPIIGSEWTQEDFSRRRMEVIQRGALSEGSALLTDLIARSKVEGDSVELARLHLELGDWYQWHAKEGRAAEQYEQVVQLLRTGQAPELLEKWLAQPVELPDNGAFWQPSLTLEPKPAAVVTAVYDVSSRGRVRNLRTEVSDSEDEGLAVRLKRKLGHIRFRPRWISGAPEAVTQMRRDYELIRP